MLHICSIMQQHVHFSTFNIKKYKNITQLQKSMQKRATVYQLSDMLQICSKYAAKPNLKRGTPFDFNLSCKKTPVYKFSCFNHNLQLSTPTIVYFLYVIPSFCTCH